MSKQGNSWNFVIVASLAIGMLACSTIQVVLYDTPAAPAPAIPTAGAPAVVPMLPAQPMPGLAGYWQEGPKVFTIAWQNGQYVVTGFNAAGSSDPEILNQSWNGTSLTWTYRTYSTSPRSHTYVTNSLSGDQLAVQWTNDLGTTGPVTLRRVSSAVPAHEILPYQDDFSDPTSGWDVSDNENGSVKYENGYYSVRGLVKNTYKTGHANRFSGDVVVAMDATAVSRPPSNKYGFEVECNVQLNGDRYRFGVEASGYYTVAIYRAGQGDQFTVIPLWAGDDYRASNAIHTGTATNHVVVTCARGNLKLEVNGQTLFQGSDSTFREGDLAVGVVTEEAVPAEYHFDNLSVTAP